MSACIVPRCFGVSTKCTIRLTTLTPMTVHRTHPVESFINSSRAVLSLGLMSGIFVWLFGHGLQVWDILGVNALGFLLTLLGANLRHSHVPFHFGGAERLFISPAQHQLHHSIAHSHPNYGSFLAIWDRFNRSWVAGSEAKSLVTEFRSQGWTSRNSVLMTCVPCLSFKSWKPPLSGSSGSYALNGLNSFHSCL